MSSTAFVQHYQNLHLERFVEDGVKRKYCQALNVEVESFSESIREKVVQGMRGRELVSEVLV